MMKISEKVNHLHESIVLKESAQSTWNSMTTAERKNYITKGKINPDVADKDWNELSSSEQDTIYDLYASGESFPKEGVKTPGFSMTDCMASLKGTADEPAKMCQWMYQDWKAGNRSNPFPENVKESKSISLEEKKKLVEEITKEHDPDMWNDEDVANMLKKMAKAYPISPSEPNSFNEQSESEFDKFWRASVKKFGVGKYTDRIKWIADQMGISEEEVKQYQRKSMGDFGESFKEQANPWAICTAQVGRGDPDKYERCVRKVKKSLGMESLKYEEKLDKLKESLLKEYYPKELGDVADGAVNKFKGDRVKAIAALANDKKLKQELEPEASDGEWYDMCADAVDDSIRIKKRENLKESAMSDSKWLMELDNKLWDKLGITSGSQLDAHPALFQKLTAEVRKAVGSKKFDSGVFDLLENENYHTMNSILEDMGAFKESMKEAISISKIKQEADALMKKGYGTLEVVDALATKYEMNPDDIAEIIDVWDNPSESLKYKEKFNKLKESLLKEQEIEYKDFTPKQKKGFGKFQGHSSSDMRKWFDLYKRKTGKSATNVDNKGDFYDFVADNELEESFRETEVPLYTPGKKTANYKGYKISTRTTYIGFQVLINGIVQSATSLDTEEDAISYAKSLIDDNDVVTKESFKEQTGADLPTLWSYAKKHSDGTVNGTVNLFKKMASDRQYPDKEVNDFLKTHLANSVVAKEEVGTAQVPLCPRCNKPMAPADDEGFVCPCGMRWRQRRGWQEKLDTIHESIFKEATSIDGMVSKIKSYLTTLGKKWETDDFVVEKRGKDKIEIRTDSTMYDLIYDPSTGDVGYSEHTKFYDFLKQNGWRSENEGGGVLIVFKD